MINSFQGPYKFLSNFYQEPDGSCVEVEYQQAKCANEDDRAKFIGLSPRAAKRLGRTVALRADWGGERLRVMRGLIRAKFQHPILQHYLLNTGDEELIEGNWWGDQYYGVCMGQGENHLGQILMEIRDELRRSKRDEY